MAFVVNPFRNHLTKQSESENWTAGSVTEAELVVVKTPVTPCRLPHPPFGAVGEIAHAIIVRSISSDSLRQQLEEDVEGEGDDDRSVLMSVLVSGAPGRSSPDDEGVRCTRLLQSTLEGLVDVESFPVFDLSDPFVVGEDADVATIVGSAFGDSFGLEAGVEGSVDGGGFLTGAEGFG